jgi:sulfite reductase alpha subunit-like flavoprotein
MTKITILFGSQTGCAEDVAERCKRQAKSRGFSPSCFAMDEYDKTQLPMENIVIFICSTTGQGEEPDNMKRFWTFLLRKDLPQDSLTGVQAAVFGLGDSSYPKYNFAGKKLYRRLLQLGARMMVERGDGDDQHPLGLDGGLDPWLNKMWTELGKRYPQVVAKLDVGIPKSTFRVIFQQQAPTASPHTKATLVENVRITTADHFQDVRHLEFETSVLYGAGDVCNFYPQNLAADVDQVISHFNWQDLADKPMHLVPNDDTKVPLLLKEVSTIRQALTSALDVFGRPRRYFFELLSYFAKNHTQAEKLMEFSTAQGQTDLYAYCHKPKRTIFEVLQDFNSVELELDYLFDLIPLMRARSFSISSCPTVHPNRINLTVAIVKYKTSLKVPRVGVCTKWLATLQRGDAVQAWITRGTMKLPSPATAIICVSPGTGIAPIRSFLEQRIEVDHATVNVLFLGIRNVEKDFYYKTQLQSWSSKGCLKLFVAASRDQSEKVYVQHEIRKQAALVWSLIEKGAHIYLSGNASQMPKDVSDALLDVIRSQGAKTEDEAKCFLAEMESKRRFQLECWS